MMRSYTYLSRSLLALGAALLVSACATRPDIVGHNDEAREWAESQRHEPKDKTRDWPGARPRPAEPPQSQPAQPPPAKQ